jgi:hypothetical protein
MPRLTETQKQAVRDLVGLPPRGNGGREVAKIAIAEVRRALDLPVPPGEGFRAPDCWLAGSQVPRWLYGGLGEASTPSDFDFYAGSWEALDRSARSLLDAGFRFRQFRGWDAPVCHVCGRPARREAPQRHDPRKLYPIRCEACGVTAGPGAEEGASARLVRLSAELFSGTGITALELESPQGEIFQLATLGVFSGPAELLAGADFSLFQFALDDRDLHFTPLAWTDLFAARLRATKLDFPPTQLRRMLKYWRRGIRPYAGTAISILAKYLLWEVTVRDPIAARKVGMERRPEA